MRKRTIAILCALALILGMIPASAPTAAAATMVDDHGVVGVAVDTQMYRVGYGIRSADPYDPDDNYGTTAAIAAVAAAAKTAGATNADRIVKDETTGQFSILLGGYGDASYRWSLGGMDEDNDGAIDEDDGLKVTCIAVTDPDGNTVLFIAMDNIGAQTSVVSAAKIKIYEETGVPLCNIIINASHSHSGPRADYDNAVMNAYRNLMVDSIANAAHDALEDSAFATIEKASYEIDDMNYVRHYENNGEYKGDNFGPSAISYGDETTTEVSKADNRMHMLRITFDESTGKMPIAFIAWRAHPKCNSTGSNEYGQDYRPYYSSDYVGAFRSYLKAQGYRTSFYQAAAGNINTYSSLYTETKLGSLVLSTTSKTNAATLETSGTYKGLQTGYLYGQELGRQAMLGLNDDSIFSTVSVGKVQAMESIYSKSGQVHPDGLIAAKAHIKNSTGLDSMTMENTGGISFPYSYIWPTSEGGDGNYYSINSIYHYNAITDTARTASANLYAISVGEDLAFLTAPNELYDRYDKEGSTVDADNDWKELENITELSIGVPIFMGYTNGSNGYIPNKLAYSYNENKDTAAEYDSIATSGRGAYEANTSDFAEGAGEEIIQQFKTMLTSLYSGAAATVKQAYCDACKQTVDWQPYVGLMGANTMPSGHFYLYEDSAAANNFQKTLSSGKTVCLDLNGHTYANQSSVTGRAFVVNTGATLSLMNHATGTTAYLQGQGSDHDYEGHAYSTREANQYGGVIKVSGGTVNQYSGVNVQRVVVDGQTTAQGGAVYVGSGTYNMYGGTISGGQVESVTVTNKEGEDTKSTTLNDYGGNVYNSDKFNMYDGIITGGKTLTNLTTGAGSGGNIYNTGTFVMGKADDTDDASPLITLGTAARYAGNIWQQSGSFTMYSGTITEGSASGVAHNMVLNGGTTSVAGGVISCTLTTKPNIQVNGGKTLTLSGDAVISGPSIKLASATAYVSLGGNFTGSAVVAASDTANVIGNTNGYTFKPGSLKYTSDTYDIVANDSNELVYKTLSSISLTTPTKTSYKWGEALDLTGMAVTATYGDGTTQDVTAGVTVSGYAPNTLGTQTVTVQYLSKTTTFNVEVVNAIESISVTKAPAKTTYLVGDSFDPAGMTVTATYTNGSSGVVTGYTCTGFDSDSVGAKTVTVTCQGKTSTFTVQVNRRLTSIAVTAPAKTEYELGDSFTSAGMAVTATFDIGGGETQTVDVTNSVTLSGNVTTTAGTQTVVVSYTEGGVTKTGTFEIVVTDPLGDSEQSGDNVCLIIDAEGNQTAYNSVTAALEAYVSDGSNFIRLQKDIDGYVSISETVYLDTNGKSITVKFLDGGKLYGIETMTDDYCVESANECGVLTAHYGTPEVAATVTVNNVSYRYLALPGDTEGTYTFHRFQLDTKKGLRTYSTSEEKTGLYFEPVFKADSQVIAAIDGNEDYYDFGVRLAKLEGQTPNYLPKVSLRAYGGTFQGMVDGAIFRLAIYNLMPTNAEISSRYNKNSDNYTDAVVQAWSQAQYLSAFDISGSVIRGEAYISVNGQIITDDSPAEISLQSAIKLVDAKYDGLGSAQKEAVSKMWAKYSTAISSWFNTEDDGVDEGLINIGNIKIDISDWFN